MSANCLIAESDQWRIRPESDATVARSSEASSGLAKCAWNPENSARVPILGAGRSGDRGRGSIHPPSAHFGDELVSVPIWHPDVAEQYESLKDPELKDKCEGLAKKIDDFIIGLTSK
jgi:hypothetical protein